MANSSRARLVGVALGALAVMCGSCEAPASNDAMLHLAAAPEDFKTLGIGKEIEVREDGRRTPKSSDYFEWWYFDGLFDDRIRAASATRRLRRRTTPIPHALSWIAA